MRNRSNYMIRFRVCIRIALLFPLFCSCFLMLYSQPASNSKFQASYLSEEAEDHITNGEYDAALKKLEKAKSLDAKNGTLDLRIAQVYCMKDDFKSALVISGKLLKGKNASPYAWQVYGTSLDMLGNVEEARAAFREGLDKYPSSGVLYMEMGILEYGEHNDSAAISWWEQGIRENYTFPSNYYWAAKVHAEQGEYLWALLYAELYMNLDRVVSPRTKEMSRLMLEAYLKSYRISGFGQPYFDFTGRGESGIGIAPQNLEEAIECAYTFALNDTLRDLQVEHLPHVRSAFTQQWFHNYDSKWKFPLAPWLHEARQSGNEVPYAWWLLYDSAPDAFMAWYEKAEMVYDLFEIWFIMEPITLHYTQPLVRELPEDKRN